MDLEELYQEVILDHSRRPRNFGVLEKPDVMVHGDNPACGDEIHLGVQFGGDGKLQEIKFSGQGCAISQASASILTDELRGMSLDEVRVYDPKALLEEIGVPIGPARLKCALLSYKVLQGAVIGSEARWPEEADLAVTAGEGGAAP